MSTDNPILNNPYEEPKNYYDTDSEGSLDYSLICKGRRMFKITKDGNSVIPTRQKGQKEIFEWNESPGEYDNHIINHCRREIGLWRDADYPNTTRVTKELLTFWFNNSERLVTKKLFFAQREAIETGIWLNEVAEKSNAGEHILDLLRKGQQTVSSDKSDQLPRIAFKMAHRFRQDCGNGLFYLLSLFQQAGI